MSSPPAALFGASPSAGHGGLATAASRTSPVGLADLDVSHIHRRESGTFAASVPLATDASAPTNLLGGGDGGAGGLLGGGDGGDLFSSTMSTTGPALTSSLLGGQSSGGLQGGVGLLGGGGLANPPSFA